MVLPITPEQVASLTGLAIYPNSPATTDDAWLFLARTDSGKRLGILAVSSNSLLDRFAGERAEQGMWTLALCPLTHANAAALRETLPWLRPQPLGLRTSAGCGDRLGLATPGHVRAVRAVGGIAPIFAQQSIREMARTGRSPADVMDDATWGIFQEGWREGAGADADHLKTPANVDRCVAAGFTLYTIDPGDHVDDAADTDDELTIRAKYRALPWPDLATTAAGLQTAYVGKRIELEDRTLALDEETLLRAAVKYGRAAAHVARMCRHLVETSELEISVDETETPTSHAEHLFIARELRRLGVRWISLAPRYVGRFEKGVDYIGDPSTSSGQALAEFEHDFAGHAAIARALGPYKLSLHSGSDKFSIYGIAAQHARGLIHLKTAGTSYLEALRVTAGFDPALFLEILAFASERYETDRASYHVSAQLAKVPRPETLADPSAGFPLPSVGDFAGQALPGLLDQFDARQVLHVTYGSVLTSERGFKQRLLAGLAAHEEEHYAALERHFVRHLKPLLTRQ